MKRKEFLDLKKKESKDILKLLYKKRSEASKKKMEIASGKEKNLKLYWILRKEIARLLTLVREAEIIERMKTKE